MVRAKQRDGESVPRTHPSNYPLITMHIPGDFHCTFGSSRSQVTFLQLLLGRPSCSRPSFCPLFPGSTRVPRTFSQRLWSRKVWWAAVSLKGESGLGREVGVSLHGVSSIPKVTG